MIQSHHIACNTYTAYTAHTQVILLIQLLHTITQVARTYHYNDTILSHNSHNIVAYIHTTLCYVYIYYIIIVVHALMIMTCIICIYCDHQTQTMTRWCMLYEYIYIIVLYVATRSIKYNVCCAYKFFYISAKSTVSGLVIYNSYMAQNGAFWTRLRGHGANYERMSCTGSQDVVSVFLPIIRCDIMT